MHSTNDFIKHVARISDSFMLSFGRNKAFILNIFGTCNIQQLNSFFRSQYDFTSALILNDLMDVRDKRAALNFFSADEIQMLLDFTATS